MHASMITHALSHAGSPAGGLAVLALEGGCDEGLGLLPPGPQPASAASTSVGIIARLFIGWAQLYPELETEALRSERASAYGLRRRSTW